MAHNRWQLYLKAIHGVIARSDTDSHGREATMALTQPSSLMMIGLNDERAFARHSAVPALARAEFNHGRPTHEVGGLMY